MFSPKQLEQRIRQLERENQLLRMAIDESPDVILLKDHKGDFLLCNRTLAEMYGTTAAAMVGRSDGDFSATPQQDAFFRQNVINVMRSGLTQVVMEESTDERTGEVRYFKSIKKPFKNQDGEDCILVIAHDVTDIRSAQAKVEASERQLRYVLQATGEGLWDWEIGSGALRHNDRWYDLLGYRPEELTGTINDFFELLHPTEVAEIRRLIARSTDEGMPYHHEHRMRHRDGHWIWVLDRGEVVERDAQGRPLRMVGSFSNIQQRKQAEFDLVQAKKQAEMASKAKSLFLANMSHEIRTPMNGIVGVLSLLEASGLTPQQQEHVAMIGQSAHALTHLIEEILDLARIEAGKLEVRAEPLDIRQLIADATQAHLPMAQAKGIALSCLVAQDLPERVRADSAWLRQVIHHLLGNALKFTHQGEVQLQVVRQQASWLCEILDTGMGIHTSELQGLFVPFTQVDGSSTRQHGGAGLGLSICKRLIEAMGGRIGVESRPGEGSRFWFSLPLEAPGHPMLSCGLAAVPDAVQDPPQGREIRRLCGKALVVEDHPLNQKLILAILEKLGLQSRMAENGLAALDALREEEFDIVLMDCQMPVMDGYETVSRIRAGQAGEHARCLRILALTANALPEDVKRCKEVGFDMHVAKPFTLETIRNALLAWLPPGPWQREHDLGRA